MRISAAVVREPEGTFTIEDVELDAPGPGEVLVEIHSVGMCHTDIGVRNQWLPMPLPAVLGHEGAGVVSAVGDGVTAVAPGDKVVLTFNSCGECAMCRGGEPAYCLDFLAHNFAGGRPDGSNALHADGALHGNFFGQSSFASHAIATERNVVKLGADADLRMVGPLGCGLLTGAGTVFNTFAPTPEQTVAVFGSGAVGLAAVMAAKVLGCRTIVAVDRVPSRLELARELGATHTVDTSQVEDVPAAVREATGMGADFAVDTTAVPAVMRASVSSLAPRGTAGLLGLGLPGTELSIDMLELAVPGRKVVGVIEGDADPHSMIPHLVELQAEGRFPFEKLVKVYPFDQINQAVDDSESGATLKPVLTLV
ncbi:MAG TPA: NAD(P)-dependent alcohol dehydrogenase [Actinomycetospora sp.]|uniref:NAD(P)-dependent alcohol dehydrogenase n=1 Tax=Actinomycetospora sp. TaxID=1872135 RepID=UPI002F4145A2